MKRYLKYIFIALTATIVAASCIEEMQLEQPVTQSDELTLVPRVKSFANQYVTKAGYSSAETKISRLAVLVFNSDGNLVHLQEAENATSVMLNKSMLKSMLNTPTQASKLATLVMIANVELDDITKADDGTSIMDNKEGLTLVGLNDYSLTFDEAQTVVSDLGEDFTGFPMVGTISGVNLLPSNEPAAALEVPLQILFAKINFSISVEAGTENQNITSPSFSLGGYSVHNVSQATSYTPPTGATVSDAYAYKEEGYVGEATGTASLNGSPVTFTLYVAESRFLHNSDLTGIYPSADWLNTTTYDHLKQQYKPVVADLATGLPGPGLATYVTIKGTYLDYRGAQWNVNYDVYLGKDNHSNFEVDRNSEYTNHITIKGIRNNSSHNGEGQVWLDHRVDVSATTDNAANVTITRETLIDAHFEVRPLRVKLPDNIDRVLLYLPKYSENNGAQINETKTGTNENWIAVENNNGRVKDITQYSSNGKRKYFTASLIKQLYLENTDEIYGIRTNSLDGDERKGQKYIQLFDGDCAWIYIDENVNGGERDAIIELVFYDKDGNALDEVETFKIIQQGLHTTASGVKIENYEEYLHTYDSQDLYTNPLTDYTQQGYKWGLEGINLSENQNVVLTGDSSSDKFYYDFFHSKDREYSNAIGSVGTYEVVGGNIADNHGLNFTNNAGISNEMTIIDMNTRPSSAIQYCLSKNKFKVDDSDAEKHTMDVHWYLPDVYEMTQILTDSKGTFSDFGQYTYWTSQPSWKTPADLLGLNYLVDDVDNARAVSIEAANTEKYTGTNASRDNHYRIRCAYSAEGIKNVDFSGTRAPEGIGAMRFYMRAWKDWDSKEKGYFSWLPKEDTNTDLIKYTMSDSYDYPVDSGDADQYFGSYLEGYGFEKNPRDENNWKTETVEGYLGVTYTSQVVLHKWPGLTTKQVISNQTVSGNPYYTLGDDKIESKSSAVTDLVKYDKDITTESLRPLGHLLDNNDLTIQFIKGPDATNNPTYEYYKVNTTTTTTTTRTWVPPTYVENILREDSKHYSLRTPGGQVQLSPDEQNYYDNTLKDYTVNIPFVGEVGYMRERLSNDEGYIYPSQETAMTAGLNAAKATNDQGDEVEIPSGIRRNVTVEQKSVSWYTYYEKTGSGLRAKYNQKTQSGIRYRYRITYTIEGAETPYYEYASGGEWNEGSPVTGDPTPNNDPPTDQLVMYGGNSLTIKANNDNEISSVKIYFSGSNVIQQGSLAGKEHTFLRFTKDGFSGAEDVASPGMSYSADGELGTMTWSGDSQTEVTFKLMLFVKIYADRLGSMFGNDPEHTQYRVNNDESKRHSIVIDQIDVRYKKKSTTGQ